MTINKSETVNIPKFWVILVLPLLFGGMSGLVTASFVMGRRTEQIETVKKEIDEVKATKVNIDVFKVIQGNIEDIKADVGTIRNDLQTHMNKR